MSCVFAYSSKIFEAVVIIVLCVIFLQFFGLSTFEKWQRKDIQVVKRKEPKKCLPPPAVTICAVSDHFLGWNKTDPNVFGLAHCRDDEDLEKCVKRLTFTLGDLLKNTSTLKISKGKKCGWNEIFPNNRSWLLPAQK